MLNYISCYFSVGLIFALSCIKLGCSATVHFKIFIYNFNAMFYYLINFPFKPMDVLIGFSCKINFMVYLILKALKLLKKMYGSVLKYFFYYSPVTFAMLLLIYEL